MVLLYFILGFMMLLDFSLLPLPLRMVRTYGAVGVCLESLCMFLLIPDLSDAQSAPVAAAGDHE